MVNVCFIGIKNGLSGRNKLGFGNVKKENQMHALEVWGPFSFVKFISEVPEISNCCMSRESASSQILSCVNVNIIFGKTGSKQFLFLFQLWS